MRGFLRLHPSRRMPGLWAAIAGMLLIHAAVFGSPQAAPKLSGLCDLAGHPANPFADSKDHLIAFLFVRTDCPISNGYAPEIRRLHDLFSPRGVAFWLVYPASESDESPDAIRRHLRDFSYPFGALRDPHLAFAKRSRVEFTPEAAIYRSDGALLYHGRIDDRYADFGKLRPQPQHHDFADALTQALAGKPVTPASGPAVGCFIETAQ
jgi:hypothetical protein